MRNWPVNPTKAAGILLRDKWGGIDNRDIGALNEILQSLYHTHTTASELQVTGARFTSSDLDVPPGDGMNPDNWIKVSGGSEFDVPFGAPTADIPRTGIALLNAFITFQVGGTNPTAVGDRLYGWLIPGQQQNQYLDVVRIIGFGGGGEVFMHLVGFQPMVAGLNSFNVFFSPALDNAGAQKTVRRGTSLEVTVLYT